ncbi:unnamed protein product [Brachionus calyciflorus]|uniref:Uncharacterized protein n=1 Tax=Brachionus calyciflorus TaxID=104777 RepID=A0A813TZ12_9BILA|nr:unnamed protein product [Brachionus calyciflorus]
MIDSPIYNPKYDESSENLLKVHQIINFKMFKINCQVRVLDNTSVWRDAIIKEIKDDNYVVHFLNFTNKFNGQYSKELIRNKCEEKLIQRNVLEVNSLELKNLIFNDKVILKHENISKEGTVLQNDPYLYIVKIKEFGCLDVPYESISKTSKSVGFKKHLSLTQTDSESCSKKLKKTCLSNSNSMNNLNETSIIQKNTSDDTILIQAEFNSITKKKFKVKLDAMFIESSIQLRTFAASIFEPLNEGTNFLSNNHQSHHQQVYIQSNIQSTETQRAQNDQESDFENSEFSRDKSSRPIFECQNNLEISPQSFNYNNKQAEKPPICSDSVYFDQNISSQHLSQLGTPFQSNSQNNVQSVNLVNQHQPVYQSLLPYNQLSQTNTVALYGSQLSSINQSSSISQSPSLSQLNQSSNYQLRSPIRTDFKSIDNYIQNKSCSEYEFLSQEEIQLLINNNKEAHLFASSLMIKIFNVNELKGRNVYGRGPESLGKIALD